MQDVGTGVKALEEVATVDSDSLLGHVAGVGVTGTLVAVGPRNDAAADTKKESRVDFAVVALRQKIIGPGRDQRGLLLSGVDVLDASGLNQLMPGLGVDSPLRSDDQLAATDSEEGTRAPSRITVDDQLPIKVLVGDGGVVVDDTLAAKRAKLGHDQTGLVGGADPVTVQEHLGSCAVQERDLSLKLREATQRLDDGLLTGSTGQMTSHAQVLEDTSIGTLRRLCRIDDPPLATVKVAQTKGSALCTAIAGDATLMGQCTGVVQSSEKLAHTDLLKANLLDAPVASAHATVNLLSDHELPLEEIGVVGVRLKLSDDVLKVLGEETTEQILQQLPVSVTPLVGKVVTVVLLLATEEDQDHAPSHVRQEEGLDLDRDMQKDLVAQKLSHKLSSLVGSDGGVSQASNLIDALRIARAPRVVEDGVDDLGELEIAGEVIIASDHAADLLSRIRRKVPEAANGSASVQDSADLNSFLQTRELTDDVERRFDEDLGESGLAASHHHAADLSHHLIVLLLGRLLWDADLDAVVLGALLSHNRAFLTVDEVVATDVLRAFSHLQKLLCRLTVQTTVPTLQHQRNLTDLHVVEHLLGGTLESVSEALDDISDHSHGVVHIPEPSILRSNARGDQRHVAEGVLVHALTLAVLDGDGRGRADDVLDILQEDVIGLQLVKDQPALTEVQVNHIPHMKKVVTRVETELLRGLLRLSNAELALKRLGKIFHVAGCKERVKVIFPTPILEPVSIFETYDLSRLFPFKSKVKDTSPNRTTLCLFASLSFPVVLLGGLRRRLMSKLITRWKS